MPRDIDRPGSPLSEEFDVGGDSDMPGADNPITIDDIDAIIHSPSGSVEDRRAALRSIIDDLETRHSMDMETDFEPLVERAQDGLRTLQGGGQGVGTPSAYGLEPDERADRPDEYQERMENEPPEGED